MHVKSYVLCIIYVVRIDYNDSHVDDEVEGCLNESVYVVTGMKIWFDEHAATTNIEEKGRAARRGMDNIVVDIISE